MHEDEQTLSAGSPSLARVKGLALSLLGLALGVAIGAGLAKSLFSPAEDRTGGLPASASVSSKGGSGVREAGRTEPVSRVEVARALKGILGGGSLAEQDRLFRKFLQEIPLEEFPIVCHELGDWFAVHEMMMDEEGSGAAHAAYETLADVMVERDGEGSLEVLLAYLEGKGVEPAREPDQISAFMTSVFRKWAKENPALAARYLAERGERLELAAARLPGDLTRDLARLWTRADPSGALSWIDRLPEGARLVALRSAIGALHHKDPEWAGRLFRANTGLPERGMLAESMASAWAKKSPEQALAWAEGLDPEAARIAVAMAIDTLASRSLETSLASFQALQGVARDEAARYVSHHYYGQTKRDFDGAARLLASEPSGPGRNAGVRDLVANWALTDADAAASWLSGILPGDASLDDAVAELGLTVGQSDPGRGVDWLSRVHDPEQRSALLQQSLDRWFRFEPQAALSWIEGTERIGEGERASLFQRYRPVFAP